MAVFRRRDGRPAPVGPQRSGGRRQPSFLLREECASAQGKKVGGAVAGARPAGRQTSHAERPPGRLGHSGPGGERRRSATPAAEHARLTRSAPYSVQGEPARASDCERPAVVAGTFYLCKARVAQRTKRRHVPPRTSVWSMAPANSPASTDTEGIMMAKYKRKKQLSSSLIDCVGSLRTTKASRPGLAKQGYSAATIIELTRLLACWANGRGAPASICDSIDPGSPPPPRSSGAAGRFAPRRAPRSCS